MPDQCDYLSRHDTGFLSMLTTGYRVGAVASKSVPAGKKGNEWQPADFVIGWPMAFAKVGDLPTAQLMSRCVVIRMQPAPVESRKPMKLARKALLFDRDNKLAPTELSLAWQDRIQKALGPHEEALGAFVSESDGEVAGRTDDVWEPLLAIAHVAGERWRLRARDAYAELKADNLMVPKPFKEYLAAILRGLQHDTRDFYQPEELMRLSGHYDEVSKASKEAAGRLLGKRGAGIPQATIRREGKAVGGYWRKDVEEQCRRWGVLREERVTGGSEGA